MGFKHYLQNNNAPLGYPWGYGNASFYKPFVAKFVFLIGKTDDPGDYDELDEHDDILVGNFVDSFQNLTFKDSMFFAWVLEAAPSMELCYKGDDDIFLNPFSFVSLLRNQSTNNEPFIWGDVMYNNKRRTDPIYGKYQDFVWNEDLYPNYTSGACLFMNRAAVEVIHENIPKLPIIPIDDAFLAICLRHGGYGSEHVINVENPSKMLKYPKIERSNLCFIENSIGLHKYEPEVIECLWPKFLDQRENCASDITIGVSKVGYMCDMKYHWYLRHIEPISEGENKGRCGKEFNYSSCPLENWDSDSGPCCSENNYCGFSKDHCSCFECIDFKNIKMSKQGNCCKKAQVFSSRSDIAGIYEYSRANDKGIYVYERRGLVKNKEELFVLQKSDQCWYIANDKEAVVAFNLNKIEKCLETGEMYGPYETSMMCIEY